MTVIKKEKIVKVKPEEIPAEPVKVDVIVETEPTIKTVEPKKPTKKAKKNK